MSKHTVGVPLPMVNLNQELLNILKGMKMKNTSIALVTLLALMTISPEFTEARGPGDRDRKEKEQRSFSPPQSGETRKFSPPAGPPAINRSNPPVQFSRPPSDERARQRSNPVFQQPPVSPQRVQPQLNMTPRVQQPQRPANIERPGAAPGVRPGLPDPSRSFQPRVERPQANQRQHLNAPPMSGFTPQRGQNFGRQPAQNQLRQFLNLPAGPERTPRQPGFGRIGAAALGGAAGAVALDQMLNRGKPPLQSAVPGHMPNRGYHFNERMGPGSAQAIRDNFPNRYPNTFNKTWWSQHPNLSNYYWHSRIWPYRPWNYWWRPATWIALSSWIAWNWGPPLIYNYGSNFYYDNSYVYLNGRRLCSAADYYDQAVSAIVRVPDVNDDVDQWMPLGVFALTRDPSVQSSVVIQLAISKEGIIQGTYFNGETGVTKPIKGIVEKENQRAVWTFADESGSTVIMETGVYNLTLDEAGVLVLLSKTQTEQWFLIRLKEPVEQDHALR